MSITKYIDEFLSAWVEVVDSGVPYDPEEEQYALFDPFSTEDAIEYYFGDSLPANGKEQIVAALGADNEWFNREQIEPR